MVTKITKITLQSFKSFRKKVSIPFLPGFNCICGPNGSGKSNILDAVLFALGNSSFKSLRVGRFNELIHKADDVAKQSEYASVSLWLDNSQKTFPFETPEVVVKRKVNKKGVSVYKINGKTTTREKVLEMLSSTRIFPDGFNIILQGDVTQVVRMSPQDRRGLIDNISGISQYNEKKIKAQRNLGIVGEKMREVEIILSERMERLHDLEIERNAALKYKDLDFELKQFKASLAHKRHQIFTNQFKSAETDVAASEEKIGLLKDEIKDVDKRLEELEGERQQLMEKMFIRSKGGGIRDEIQEITNKILRNKDKIDANQREIDRINNMVTKLEAFRSGKAGLFKKSVKIVLDLKRKGVFGTISNILKVPKHYETAVEIAGGSNLQDLVVDSTKTASDMISFLKRERVGRATFLPLDKIKPRRLSPEQRRLLKIPGVIGLTSELIKFDSKYSDAVKHIFGSTLLVENLGVARQAGIGRVRMVTLDGDLTETSGAMKGGFYRKGGEGLLEGTNAEIEEYGKAKNELEEEINFLRIEVGELNQKMDELREKQKSETDGVSGLDTKRTEIDEESNKLKADRQLKFEEMLNLQSKINRLKIKGARTEAEIENLKLEVERYGEIEYIEEEPEILEGKITRTIGSLNALGIVNMKAIEVYDSFKVEFDELKQKYDKVSRERNAIMEMIEDIEGKRKEVFYQCLRSIDRNFRRVFREIIRGEASLELQDPMDIESGLLIQATPAGKNMLNIDAMSGGEKTLTALAFLFAVQMHKPAPFYVLDEIDAALDKVNSNKVAKMIKKFSETEQFILITHNDYTIRHGDRVYGVSMTNGQSKILGLELPKLTPQ